MKSIAKKILFLAVGITLVVSIAVGLTTLIFSNETTNQNINFVSKHLRSDYDSSIKEVTLEARSMLQALARERDAGNLTDKQARRLGADLLRQLTYGNNSYFWADTYEGVNVVLLGSPTEGTYRWNVQDLRGNFYIKELNKAGKNPEGGFVDYWFPKRGEKMAAAKRGYAIAFEPFQWTLGTGNYVDDINTAVNVFETNEIQALRANIAVALGILLFGLLVAIFLSVSLGRQVARPLQELDRSLERLAQGDSSLTEILPARTSDEVGRLALTFNRFLQRLAKIIEKERAYWSLTDKLALLAEAHDKNTAEHTLRVGAISEYLSKKMGFNPEDCEKIRKAAVLHDVGKLFLDPFLINKTGQITKDEREILKSHTLLAEKILEGPIFDLERKIAVYHHERFNGSGYPYGMSGNDIPMEAQIVGVADVYDALRTSRSYKGELPVEVVLHIMRYGDDRMSADEFNPKILLILEENIRDVEIIWSSRQGEPVKVMAS